MMIWFIQWKILEIGENTVLVLTPSWVWYEVWINTISYASLVWESSVELYIYHHITESGQSLFWFLSKQEKNIFSELIKISGVWGKVAQNILSLWTEKLATALAFEDSKTIESIKGIGKKMAEKIILELKDKDIILENQASGWEETKNNNISSLAQSQIVETLMTMWYNKEQILSSLSQTPEWMTEVDEILPFVIKNI